MHWLLERRYQALLICMACMFLMYAPLRRLEASWLAYQVLHTLVFVAGLAVVWQRWRMRLPALLLGLVVLLAAWADRFGPDWLSAWVDPMYHAAASLFFGMAVATLLADIARAKRVSRQQIYAALGSYLLIGTVFAHVYCLVEWWAPGSFAGGPNIQAELQERTRRFFLLVYFSLSTLTTVSYGDITPGSDAVRALGMLEAVTGQFYIVVLVATLVGQHVAQATSSHDNENDKA